MVNCDKWAVHTVTMKKHYLGERNPLEVAITIVLRVCIHAWTYIYDCRTVWIPDQNWTY